MSLACALVLGVFAGSALWWLLLSHGVGLVASRAKPRYVAIVNRISGAILVGFGLYSLGNALLQ